MLAKLKLFNEKADRLVRSRYVEAATAPNVEFTVSITKSSPPIASSTRPDEEAVDSFALTLRFFLQPRDGISIGQMFDIYESLPLTDEQRDGLQRSKRNVLAYLDGSSPYQQDDRTLTNRELVEVYLYGHLAHLNADKRITYMRFAATPFKGIVDTFFDDACIELVNIIVWMKDFNEQLMTNPAL